MWLLSIAYALGCALAVYIVLRIAGSTRYSRADHIRSAAAVFVLVAVLVAWRIQSDPIAPDPYEDAQSAFAAS